MTHCTHGSECYKQWSPNFLAPGTSFIEDNSSTDGGNRQGGMASGWFKRIAFYCSSVTQSCLTLQLHGLQHARLPCPSPSAGAGSHSPPLGQWCFPTLWSSVIPFSSCSVFPSISLFWWVSSSHLVAQVWSFSFSISPSNEYSGLTSFRIDWFDLLAVQGTLKSLLQHHSSKASILHHSAFFMVQLSHPYMTPGKTTALHLLCTLFLMWCHCWSDERYQWVCGPEVGDPC